jgi:hypothetical protein
VTPHIEGHPVNASTYCNWKCRCAGCTDAWRIRHADYMRRHPEQATKHAERMRARRANGLTDADRAVSRAKTKAVGWVRHSHPDVWQQLLTDAYADLGVERRPVGRPK